MSQGVFSSWPKSTEQFKRWLPNRNHEYFETMARMYIEVPKAKRIEKIKKKIGPSGKNQDAVDYGPQNLVDVLVGDGSSNTGFGYLDFLLHSADHQYQEKMQLCEVLSDNYVAFFFGQAPPIFSYTGTLMNTWEDNWLVNMYRLFQYLGRGTKLAQYGLELQLVYDSFTFFGAMTNLNWRLVGGQESHVAFTFNFLVKKAHIVLSNENYPYSVRRQDIDLAQAIQELEDAVFGSNDAAVQEVSVGYPGEPGFSDPGETAEVEETTVAEIGDDPLDDLLFPGGLADPIDPYDYSGISHLNPDTFLDTASPGAIAALDNSYSNGDTTSAGHFYTNMYIEGDPDAFGPPSEDPDAFPESG